jgi:hypothetical protein
VTRLTLNGRIGMPVVRSGVRSGAYQHQIGSRASATVSTLDQHRPTAGRVLACVTDFREGSGAVVVRTLIYVKTSSDRRRKSVGA